VSLFLPAFPDAGGLLFVAIYADFIMAVNKEQTGHGGFQTLLRKMKDQYSEQSEEFYLDKEDIERLHRYAYEYGRGGFQDRIQRLLVKLNIIKEDLIKILG
jgi:hypothetical protein